MRFLIEIEDAVADEMALDDAGEEDIEGEDDDDIPIQVGSHPRLFPLFNLQLRSIKSTLTNPGYVGCLDWRYGWLPRSRPCQCFSTDKWCEQEHSCYYPRQLNYALCIVSSGDCLTYLPT